MKISIILLDHTILWGRAGEPIQNFTPLSLSHGVEEALRIMSDDMKQDKKIQIYIFLHLSNTHYERVESLEGLSFFEKLTLKKHLKNRHASHCIAFGSIPTKDGGTIYIRQHPSALLDEFFKVCERLVYPIVGVYSLTFALSQYAVTLARRKTPEIPPWLVSYFQMPHMPDFLVVLHKQCPSLIRVLHDPSNGHQEITKIFKHVQAQSSEKLTFVCLSDHLQLGESLPWGQFILDHTITNPFELLNSSAPLFSPLDTKCFLWRSTLQLKTATLIAVCALMVFLGFSSWYEWNLDHNIMAWEGQKANTHEILLPQGFHTQKAIVQLSDLSYKSHPLKRWQQLDKSIRNLPPLMRFEYHQNQTSETLRLTFKADMNAQDICETLSKTLLTKSITTLAKPTFMDHTKAYVVTPHQDETDASLTFEMNFQHKNDQEEP
jgi:hypothetical protein